MSTHAGYGGLVKVGTDIVAEVKDFSLEITANTAESTVMNPTVADDAGWTKAKVTTKSWTSSLNVIWDDDDAGQGALLTEGARVDLELYPRGATSGFEKWKGFGHITSVSKNVGVDGLVEASVTVTGDGVIAESAV